MRRRDLHDYCGRLPGAWFDNPWGEEDHVVKVGSKIFCFLGAAEGRVGICVKNTRELVAEWRTRFPDHVEAPRYLNKQLWNQVWFDGPGAPDLDDAHELIDDSYALVVAGLPKSQRP